MINLSSITSTPSPNYLLVLQLAQQKAIDEDAALVIVESDVLVQTNTLQALIDTAQQKRMLEWWLLLPWTKVEM